MSKTKILVFQKKELIYTGIFIGLGILLIALLCIMFCPKNSTPTSTNSETVLYYPGVYTTQIQLGNRSLNLEVTVDQSQIKSVSLVNLEESVSTMYPLVEPSLEYIEKELIAGTPLDQIPSNEKNKYTQSMLISGIESALEQARINELD